MSIKIEVKMIMGNSITFYNRERVRIFYVELSSSIIKIFITILFMLDFLLYNTRKNHSNNRSFSTHIGKQRYDLNQNKTLLYIMTCIIECW